MTISLLEIFHYLPYPLKVVAASLKGSYLQHLRYGRDLERLVQETLDRETWDAKRWEEWQSECLAVILHRAATKVPYYKNYWENERKQGNRASWAYLENWPFLSKEAVRQNPKAFVAEDCHISKMYTDHTSGTTGTPLVIYQTKETIRYWYALSEARWRRWYGVSIHDRWALFGGQMVTAFTRHQPPFWVWNSGSNQLYFSAYHLNKEATPHYNKALISHKINYIIGYPSAIYSLARFGLELKLDPPKVNLLLSNAEPLYDFQQTIIESFFRNRIYDTFGLAEKVFAASECKDNFMHLWPEVGYYEVLNKDSKPQKIGESGRLISTGLINHDMPLIRYETGDQVAINWKFNPCKCGRTLPTLTKIEGRVDDLIITKDGREIGRLSPVLKKDYQIREAQIIQEDIDRFTIRYVKADQKSKVDFKGLEKALCQRVGDVHVDFEAVEHIPRTKSGKFRAVVSKLDKEIR
jgi:phenylacetate-CoA ligase